MNKAQIVSDFKSSFSVGKVLAFAALTIVVGDAPEALDGLPQPNAVFVGGGIDAPGVLTKLWAMLSSGGRLVANVVSVDGEARLFDWHAAHGGALTRIAVSRAELRGRHHLWRPMAAVTQLCLVKEN